MQFSKLHILFLSVLVFIFSACKKDEEESSADTTKPVINISSPTNHQVFNRGDTIFVNGTITDNENLASYRIEVHSAVGHDHKSSSRSNVWVYNFTHDMDGKSYSLDHKIKIDADADSSEYHFIVNALDAAGNAAEFVEVDIRIE